MTKKKWLIPVSIFVAMVLIIATGIGIMISKGLGCSVGRYLPTENGTSILIVDNSPIVMSNRTNRELFGKLNVGDKILVIHDGIKETYPGGTGAYAVIKLQDGSNEDIPQKVVDELTELGWYPAKVSKEQKISYEGPLSCVTHHSGWGRMSLMDMTEEFHEKVLEMLNSGTWMNDVTKCESDYEFETKGETIRYHSECGTFNDITNRRSLSLSDEEQAEINRMLGAK